MRGGKKGAVVDKLETRHSFTGDTLIKRLEDIQNFQKSVKSNGLSNGLNCEEVLPDSQKLWGIKCGILEKRW